MFVKNVIDDYSNENDVHDHDNDNSNNDDVH